MKKRGTKSDIKVRCRMAKIMMHTFRLSNMAEEIALHWKVIVKRNGGQFLLYGRNGEFEFDKLMQIVEEKM